MLVEIQHLLNCQFVGAAGHLPLTAWVPPRPRSRKKVVPTNSRSAAIALSRKFENCDESDMLTCSYRFFTSGLVSSIIGVEEQFQAVHHCPECM